MSGRAAGRARLGDRVGAGAQRRAGAVGLAAVLVGAAVVARHRAGSAADLAALAGCRAGGARRSARLRASPARWRAANGARLDSCPVAAAAWSRWRVSVRVRLGPLGQRTATARARAGPVPPAPARGRRGQKTRSSSGGSVGSRGRGRRRSVRRRRRRAVVVRGEPVVGGGELVEDDVQHADRAGLVQRVVAVAALGRLDAGGAAALALAAGDGGPGGLQPLAAARRTRARRSRRRRGGRRRRRSSRSRCPGAARWTGRRGPSGRRWPAAAGCRSRRARRRAGSRAASASSTSARSTARSPSVSHTARVRSWRAGRSRGNSASTSPVPSRRRW